MSEDLIIKHCSPTLAGLKTANLFTCTYTSKTNVEKASEYFNKIFNPKGVRLLPLKYRENRVLVYIFRPKRLEKDLTDTKARNILTQAGYSSFDVESCLQRLIHRINGCQEFPHEIGLFLGYPPEDVQGFICHKGCCCQCCGCWKVYSNREKAEREFAKYKKCSDVYYSKWITGTSIRKLVVSLQSV